MSRTSLRRQLFHRNLDLLLQNGSLDTLVEEDTGRADNKLQGHQVAATTEKEQEDNHSNTVGGGSKKNLSPIYKPRQKMIPKENDAECSSDQPSTPYYAPWDQNGTQPNGRPSTPYTEIDDSVNCIDSKSKRKPETLVFQFPDTGVSLRSKRDSLPFSPINRNSVQSVRSLFRGHDGCQTCSKKEEVRPLPMSPALMMTSHTTSTPGPSGVGMDSPHCRTLLDNINSLFNFSSECNMCRICHEDGSEERLVSPCHCAGTMGMLHISCLEQWLGSSNTTKCEICQFQFVVQKKPRSFKWYMQEPSLQKDKSLMIRDIVLTVAIGSIVLMISVICLIFAQQLTRDEKVGPAVVLILLSLTSLIIFSIWILVAGRRMRQRVRSWQEEHHIVQIKQKKGGDPNASNKIFRRFPVRFSARNKRKAGNKTMVEGNLISSTFIACSLESYKAAMFNPVTPSQPLLQDENNNEITSLDENSSSVISLEEIIQNCVSYYQPPVCGTTATILDDSGKRVKETGV